ncbi:hypothetical protein ACJX0J_015805, partial [Zea mays]
MPMQILNFNHHIIMLNVPLANFLWGLASIIMYIIDFDIIVICCKKDRIGFMYYPSYPVHGRLCLRYGVIQYIFLLKIYFTWKYRAMVNYKKEVIVQILNDAVNNNPKRELTPNGESWGFRQGSSVVLIV